MNIDNYLAETVQIASSLDRNNLQNLLDGLTNLKNNNGRLFIIGVGGSAANASHAVNDFRKIAEIDACTPLDNVSELTARINDDGWDSCITNTLRVSNFSDKDAILTLSVGGGSEKTSLNLVRAMEYAKSVNGKVFGIVSRDGGMTASLADACVIIPTVNKETITPHAEEFQAVVWHMLVTLLGEQ
jgi:D-sedoheptulose 7-phosphate isomerase